MQDASERSEVIRRISAGRLPRVAHFIVVQANAGAGICRGRGKALSAGEPRCIVDCENVNLGPFPMHAACFLVWSEACMREREEGTPDFIVSTDASRVASPPPELHAVDRFCPIRLELLNAWMRRSHDFVDSIRDMRRTGAATARKACEQARLEALRARETYEYHLDDHRR